MKEKIIRELDYLYEKEKYNFMTKYYLNENKYTLDDLIPVIEDIHSMLERMEKVIETANYVYNFMNFDKELYTDNKEYIFANEGLHVYNKYIYFISNCRGLLKFHEEKYMNKEYDVNYYLFVVLEQVISEFSVAETEIRLMAKVDLNFAIAEVMKEDNCWKNNILFYDEDANAYVDIFVDRLEGYNVNVFELTEDDFDLNLNALKDINVNLTKNGFEKQIIVIKNIDNVIFEQESRNEFLTLLSNLYEEYQVILFLTSENPYHVEDFKELAGIKFNINRKDCYYII